MTKHQQDPSPRSRIARRALLASAAVSLSGCSFFEDLFTTNKPKLAGDRIAVMAAKNGLAVDPAYHPKITLPPPSQSPDWLQPGGGPTHEMGHSALADTIRKVWSSSIGTGGGYRRKISAQPVIQGTRVCTMDSEGYVTCFNAVDGRRQWEFDTQGEDDRSSNVGGGLSIDGTTLYAATGRAELIALDIATGKQRWRQHLPSPARAAGTVAGGTVFVPTLDDQIVAFAATDGKKLWNHQAQTSATSVLGLPSPAVAEGIVVGGFGSGDIAAFRTDSGSVAWSDNLAPATGRNSIVDLATVRGLPVIVNGQLYATSIAGLTVADDLRSGRRIWERDAGSYEAPCVAGDWMFLLGTDQQLAAISRADGQVAWASQMPQFEDMEKHKDPINWHGPVLAGDRLLLAGSNSKAIAVSPYTGKILGTQDLPDKGSVSPVVAGGTAYFVVDDGSLIAFR